MQITLQPEALTPEADSLAYRLFALDKLAEFAAIGLPQPQAEALVQMQWRGRTLTYANQYPGAEDWTISLEDGTPIGRYLLQKTPQGSRMVDFAILPEWRGQGIGTQVLQKLIHSTATNGAVFSLRVEKNNRALYLYKRLGLTIISSDEISFEMEWKPERTATTSPTSDAQPSTENLKPEAHITLESGDTLDRTFVLDRIFAFLREIGFNIHLAELPGKTFLPGIQIVANGLNVDIDALLYPGDLLHEAGHLAVMPPENRRLDVPPTGDAAEEIAAIAWSYAAIVYLDLPPEVVFHPQGYRGNSNTLAHGFATGNRPGLPLLWWMGLTTQPTPETPSIYPKMLRWVRQTTSPIETETPQELLRQ
jgi:ribosomal protein S18 acetylase RimI-like enzyme